MTYKLKPEYKGLRITIGPLVFDDDINNESEYPYYFSNGFSQLFEVSKPKVKTKNYKAVVNKKKDGK